MFCPSSIRNPHVNLRFYLSEQTMVPSPHSVNGKPYLYVRSGYALLGRPGRVRMLLAARPDLVLHIFYARDVLGHVLREALHLAVLDGARQRDLAGPHRDVDVGSIDTIILGERLADQL